MNRRRPHGQVLVIFALSLVGLVAMAALAVDLASVYSTQQTEKAAADAAALAGAQDLQVKDSRALGDPVAARTHALWTLAGRFGVAPPELTGPCDPSVDITDCPLGGSTPYLVSISSPSQTPTTSDPKSVQVTVRNPSYQLWFARLFGQNGWNVGEASVAVVDNSHSYALLTLRPPTAPSIPNVRDLYLNGNYTTVNVINGDVGINANMIYNGSNALLTLSPNYKLYFDDPYNPPLWSNPANPPGNPLSALIQDPGYNIPSPPASGHKGVEDVDTTLSHPCLDIATALLASGSGYRPYIPFIPGTPPNPNTPDMSNIHCYKAGVYDSTVSAMGCSSPSGCTIPNGTLAIFEPGLYFFRAGPHGQPGLSVQGSLIGGWNSAVAGDALAGEGVALVFDESQGQQFVNRTSGGGSGNGSASARGVLLNAGGALASPATGTASAALDYLGNPVVTNTTPPIPMTVMVQRDQNCLYSTGDSIRMVLPVTCTNNEENKNIALNLAGGSDIYLAGVQFAPTDNMQLSGGSSGLGFVGQVVTWTTQYTGNTPIEQEGMVFPTNGVLRLDKVCSGGNTPCTHP